MRLDILGRIGLCFYFFCEALPFYAINIPFSKILLEKVTLTFMASFLYLGAALGIGIIYLLTGKKQNENKLNKDTKKIRYPA